MPVMTLLARSLAVALSALIAAAGLTPASTSQAAVLRAVGPGLSPETIRYVAQNAEGREVDPATFADPEGLTPRIVISRLCGQLTETYYQAFLDANARKPAPDEVVGLSAAELVWPACFYVNVLDGAQVTVLPGDTSYKIYARLTGGKPTDAQLAAFFVGSDLTWEQLANLQAGQILTVHHVTEAVNFRPKAPLSSEQFVAGLAQAARARGPLSVSARTTNPDQGKILVGDPPPAPGAPSDPGRHCRAPGVAPFDPKAVFNAYRFALTRKLTTPSVASLAIVDNGFFGAQLGPPGEEFKTSPFKAAFFQSDNNAVIARKLQIGAPLWPINYAYDDLSAAPEIDKGHGTHVTGLALGGPTFKPYWDTLLDSGKPWVEITQLNVGRGSRHLIGGSESSLASALGAGKAWIVNLSVGFDGGKDQQMVKTFDDLFGQNAASLFVVSAGNDRNDVNVITAYPAAFGGPLSPNVISVAALDGDDGLAPFSNYSRDAVDIAAPGCGVASWLKDTQATTALNGTSQSAPLVAFEAALLRSLSGKADARDLKARAIVSGDLLRRKTPVGALDKWRDAAPDMVAYRVKLNIPIALFWADDYLKITGSDAGEYLGDVWDVTSVGCVDKADIDRDDLWSFKREDGGGWLYSGRKQRRLYLPCQLDTIREPNLAFLATHKIIDGKPEPLAGGIKDLSPAFADVVHLVRKANLAN